jgi:hypothetical protein
MVAVVEHLLAKKMYPELGYRAIMGITNLTTQYPKERVEKALFFIIRFRAKAIHIYRHLLYIYSYAIKKR